MGPHGPDSFTPKVVGIMVGGLHGPFPPWPVKVDCYGLDLECPLQAHALTIWFPVCGADLKAVEPVGSRPGWWEQVTRGEPLMLFLFLVLLGLPAS